MGSKGQTVAHGATHGSGALSLLDDYRAATARIEASDGAGQPLGLADALGRCVETARRAAADRRKLMLIGNGGSAAIASHQAVDLWKNGGVRAIAFNDASLLTCIANDCGYEHVFERPVEMFGEAGDVLVAISSSGASVSIVNAARRARSMGCGVLTLSGFAADNALRRLGDVNLYTPSTSYGVVEVSHLTLLHVVLDSIIACGDPRAPEAQ